MWGRFCGLNSGIFFYTYIFSPFFFFFFFCYGIRRVQPINKRPKDGLQFIFKLFLLTNSNEYRCRIIFIWIHNFVKQVVPIQQEQLRVIKVTRQSRSRYSALKVLEEGFFSSLHINAGQFWIWSWVFFIHSLSSRPKFRSHQRE